MCGRVTLTKRGIREIAEDLDAELSPDDVPLYRPRYNVAPSDLSWIVEPGAGSRVLLPAVWGYRAGSRLLVNVRGEQAATGGGFRDAFASHRCVVVTDGFYEWTRDHAPFWFHREDGGLVLLAGLDQRADGGYGGPANRRFTILTTRPNAVVAAVHDRMPVVLPFDRIDDWLTAPLSLAAKLLEPAPDDALVARAVSKRVSSVKEDDPTCLDAADPAPARQLALF